MANERHDPDTSLDTGLDPDAKQTHDLPRRGGAGDAQPNYEDPDPTTRGGKPQEDVADRQVVSTVTPEDYPEQDRADSRPD